MWKIRILVGEYQFTSPYEHIIDALIFDSNSRRTQTKLLQKGNTLTPDSALNIAKKEKVTNNLIKGVATNKFYSNWCF